MPRWLYLIQVSHQTAEKATLLKPFRYRLMPWSAASWQNQGRPCFSACPPLISARTRSSLPAHQSQSSPVFTGSPNMKHRPIWWLCRPMRHRWSTVFTGIYLDSVILKCSIAGWPVCKYHYNPGSTAQSPWDESRSHGSSSSLVKSLSESFACSSLFLQLAHHQDWWHRLQASFLCNGTGDPSRQIHPLKPSPPAITTLYPVENIPNFFIILAAEEYIQSSYRVWPGRCVQKIPQWFPRRL